MTTLAVMQPTFLPWLGYFALLDQADHFVFLDDVQLSKQSWQTRNRIKGPNGPVMLSLGVTRKPSAPLICEAKLADTGFEAKLLKTVAVNLGRAPHYDLVAKLLEQVFQDAGGRLAALNMGLIRMIAQKTGINTPLYRASDLKVQERSSRSSRLLELCSNFNANHYLSPIGSYDYLTDEGEFENSDTALAYLNFTHPEYPQLFGAFESHMAAIDALAHVGPEQFLPLVRSGLGAPIAASDFARALI